MSDEVKDIFNEIESGEALDALVTYLNLHKGKITSHWLWVVIARVGSGESEADVLNDYGWVQSPPKEVAK